VGVGPYVPGMPDEGSGGGKKKVGLKRIQGIKSGGSCLFEVWGRTQEGRNEGKIKNPGYHERNKRVVRKGRLGL